MAEESEELDLDGMTEGQRKLIDSLGEDNEDNAPAQPPTPAAPEKVPDASVEDNAATKGEIETPAEEVEEKTGDQPKNETPADQDKKIDGLSKALQQVQQTMAAILRKQEENGTLSDKEQKKLQDAKDKAAEIQDDLADIRTIAGRNDTDGDVYSENPKLAKSQIKLAERLEKLEKKNAELETKLSAKSPEPATETAFSWDQEAKATGVADVQKFWTSAMTDAEARPSIKRAAELVKAKRLDQAEYEEMLRGEASGIYHDKVEAAKKKAPTPTPTPTPTPPKTARRVPPMTPNGARVTAQGSPTPAGPLTGEAREQHLLNLLAEED